MIYSALVSTFFRIVNIVILIAIAVYAYKKYLKNILIGTFEQSQKEKRDLTENVHEKSTALERTEKQLENDNILIQTLMIKMEKWQNQQHLATQEHEKKIKKQIETLHQNSRVKEQNLAHNIAQKANITYIISYAHKELSNHFRNHEKYTNYMHSVMRILQEGDSQK